MYYSCLLSDEAYSIINKLLFKNQYQQECMCEKEQLKVLESDFLD